MKSLDLAEVPYTKTEPRLRKEVPSSCGPTQFHKVVVGFGCFIGESSPGVTEGDLG